MTYREAGVDLSGAGRHIDNISESVRSTWTKAVVGGFGDFAAGVELPSDLDDPILMMSTDGVGTKLDLARRSGIWEGVGFDLVAMCVDDLAAVGARPLGFVDYMAVGALDPTRDKTIVDSIARACTAAGCPLLGGETAEHPGVMEPDAVDLAGAVMGVVEREERFDPASVTDGDVVIGLMSPNLRSNGFSLVRHVFGDEDDYSLLLEPSVIYSPAVLEHAGVIKSAAHITGGGLPGNVPRALPPGLGVTIDPGAWDPPGVFDLIADRGVERDEMFTTFNMGIGFCVITTEAEANTLASGLSAHQARVIGRVTDTGIFELR